MSESPDTNLKKTSFLEAFKALGYRNKAALQAAIDPHTVSYWLNTDPAFKVQYELLKTAWKEQRKESLETLMYENGMTPGGVRDRMAWLQKNFPEEYNPKSVVVEKKETDDTIKNLSKKIEGYGGKDGQGKS